MTWLLTDVSVDANGTAVESDGAGKLLVVWATDFGSGTVTIQVSPDGGTTWIALLVIGTAVAFTANAAQFLDWIGQGLQIRAVLSGSSGADSVNARLF